MILPRSEIEIKIAYELLEFIDFDVTDIKVESETDNSIKQVDIKIPDWNIIIEYDGTHWHKEKKEQDKRKTEQLQALGWRVIRCRSKQLGPITSDDIVIEEMKHRQPKPVVEHLITRFVEIGYLTSNDLEEYQAKDCLINEQKSNAYIEALLTDKYNRSG